MQRWFTGWMSGYQGQQEHPVREVDSVCVCQSQTPNCRKKKKSYWRNWVTKTPPLAPPTKTASYSASPSHYPEAHSLSSPHPHQTPHPPWARNPSSLSPSPPSVPPSTSDPRSAGRPLTSLWAGSLSVTMPTVIVCFLCLWGQRERR